MEIARRDDGGYLAGALGVRSDNPGGFRPPCLAREHDSLSSQHGATLSQDAYSENRRLSIHRNFGVDDKRGLSKEFLNTMRNQDRRLGHWPSEGSKASKEVMARREQTMVPGESSAQTQHQDQKSLSMDEHRTNPANMRRISAGRYSPPNTQEEALDSALDYTSSFSTRRLAEASRYPRVRSEDIEYEAQHSTLRTNIMKRNYERGRGFFHGTTHIRENREDIPGGRLSLGRPGEKVEMLPFKGREVPPRQGPKQADIAHVCQTVSRDDTSSEEAKILQMLRGAMGPYVRETVDGISSGNAMPFDR